MRKSPWDHSTATSEPIEQIVIRPARHPDYRIEELEEGDVDVAVKQKDDGQSVIANREDGIGALQGAGVIDTAAVEDPSGAIDAQAAMIGGHVLIRRGA